MFSERFLFITAILCLLLSRISLRLSYKYAKNDSIKSNKYYYLSLFFWVIAILCWLINIF